jgi:hypothetical protein
VDLSSVVNWLTGSAEAKPTPTQETLAPPLANYPTTMDADYARKYGYGYNSPSEPYLNNKMAHLLGEKERWNVGKGYDSSHYYADKSAGKSAQYLTSPANGVDVDLTKRDPLNPDLRGVMDNTYMRAALAANRSPVASIGYDPTKFNVDPYSGPLSIGGMYTSNNDQGWSGVAPTDNLVHESTHRGMELLRRAYPEEVKKLKLPPEEMVVRYLMQSKAGNPEWEAAETYKNALGVDSSLGEQQQMQAKQMFNDPYVGKEYQKNLNDLNELAIRYHKERNPRGPH